MRRDLGLREKREKKMIDSKFAVIGDEYLPTIFKLIGGDVYSVYGEKKTRETFLKLVSEYKLIFIFSDYARFVSDIIDSFESAYPLVVVLPSHAQDDYGAQKLKESTKNVLNLNLNFD